MPWTKYEYVCTNCDTLIEITTLHGGANQCECHEENIGDPSCVCAESAMLRVNKYNPNE